jgi:antitoxin component YwqK of YwqJK toxin-antitoxin module
LERAFYGPNGDYYSSDWMTDHPNNFTGQWKIFYPNGQLYTKYNVKDGIHTEPWIVFNKDGSIKGTHYPCENGYHVKYVYEADKPKETGKIINNKKEGIWTMYYRNGTVESKGSYSNGEKKGDWHEYHDNGTLKEAGAYLHDKRVSTWNTYYDDGITLYETGSYGSYNAGGKNGVWTTFHRNGALKIGCYYNRGYMNGKYEQYRKDGSLKQSGIMEYDTETGIWFESKKSEFVPGGRVPTYTMYPEKKDD